MIVVDDFRNPEVVEIGGRKVTISSIPSVEGLSIYRAIVPFIRDNGSLGITLIPQNIIIQITKFTAVELQDGGKLPLETVDSLNANFDMFGILSIVKKMYDKNFGFFADGSLQKLLLEEGTAQS